MELTATELMDFVARVQAGNDFEEQLALFPEEKREALREIAFIVVVGDDGQLQNIQPIDYTMR